MNAISLYRLSSWLYRHHLLILARLICGLIFILYNSYIPYTCSIGKNTKFGYKGIGVVVHSRAIIGNNCIIGQGVTIGGRNKSIDVPVIGDNVHISSGARVLGPIEIGDNVIIGANAVMISDAPSNSIWAGIPARMLKENVDINYYE